MNSPVFEVQREVVIQDTNGNAYRITIPVELTDEEVLSSLGVGIVILPIKMH